jgi:hypothetical protein
MSSASGARIQAIFAIVVFSLVLGRLANLEAQPQPPSGSTAPVTSADAVDIKVVQRSANELEVMASKGDLHARLSLLLKEHALLYYLHRRPGKPADGWPWFIDSAPLLRSCLRTAVSEPGKLPSFRFTTRLAMYPEMSARIALQAGISKKWDHHFGRPKASFTDSFVMGLARDNDTYPELRTLFAGQQFQIQLESMEKISIAGVRDLPYRDILAAEGLSPQWLVPYDAILHFRAKYAP